MIGKVNNNNKGIVHLKSQQDYTLGPYYTRQLYCAAHPPSVITLITH